ncbi:MAG: YkgJ family cysteine cluster protein [Proteobacteria bacterium]|nr:YkgJ family cysteine cluster protein [Pseudomonadota bacterium]
MQFDRAEVSRALRPHVVPAATRKYVILAGTEGLDPRCSMLEGEVGSRCRCGIYANRPSPCRDVLASLSDGRRDPTCDEARKKHGLPRLTFADWR